MDAGGSETCNTYKPNICYAIRLCYHLRTVRYKADHFSDAKNREIFVEQDSSILRWSCIRRATFSCLLYVTVGTRYLAPEESEAWTVCPTHIVSCWWYPATHLSFLGVLHNVSTTTTTLLGMAMNFLSGTFIKIIAFRPIPLGAGKYRARVPPYRVSARLVHNLLTHHTEDELM